jgi:hypothetical protein
MVIQEAVRKKLVAVDMHSIAAILLERIRFNNGAMPEMSAWKMEVMRSSVVFV